MSVPGRAVPPGGLKRLIEATFQEKEIKACIVDGKWNLEKIRALCESRNLGQEADAIHDYLCRMARRMKLLVLAAFALFFLAWLNAWSFVIATTCIGGDAAHGKCENGRYYVAMKGHHREVSRGTWLYSKIHGTSVVIGLPIGMGAMGAVFLFSGLNRERRHPRHRQLLLKGLVGSVVRITIAVVIVFTIAALWFWISQHY